MNKLEVLMHHADPHFIRLCRVTDVDFFSVYGDCTSVGPVKAEEYTHQS